MAALSRPLCRLRDQEARDRPRARGARREARHKAPAGARRAGAARKERREGDAGAPGDAGGATRRSRAEERDGRGFAKGGGRATHRVGGVRGVRDEDETHQGEPIVEGFGEGRRRRGGGGGGGGGGGSRGPPPPGEDPGETSASVVRALLDVTVAVRFRCSTRIWTCTRGRTRRAFGSAIRAPGGAAAPREYVHERTRSPSARRGAVGAQPETRAPAQCQ